jgi:ATP-binding cassette subfamily B protein
MRRYRRGLVWGILALVLRNLFAAAVPLGIGFAVDALSARFEMREAVQFALLLVVLTAVKGVCQYWMRVILIGISRDVEFDLRNDLFRRLLDLSAGFYARVRTGDIMARATNDLNAVRMMLGPGVMYTADTVLTAVLAVAIMAGVDWKLTLLALAPAPLVTVLVRYLGRFIHDQFLTIQGIFSDISSRVQENLSGVRVVRAYVQEEAEQKLFDELNLRYITQTLRLARVSGFFAPALQGLTGVSFLIVLWYGGYRLLNSEITLGTFLMFNVYLGMLIWPMVAMGWVVNLIQRGAASLERIDGLLREEPTVTDPPRPLPLPDPLRGELRFERVSLRFGQTTVLGGIDLEIPAGATVAIVGHTGSGKSSLVQLVPRIHDPSEGRILLDGRDTRDLRLEELRRAIGFVPQETFLFSATLAENIAFGRPDATEDEIRRAAEIAGLAGDVAGFPEGYRTLLGERGITMSGGQKQRTAIARAILRNPRILILDDALSSVDTETEERILAALTEYLKGRTTILISHRVSTVRHADRIFVIEDGRIAEEGDHESLLAAGRWYADLYRKQLLEEELEAV